MYRRVEASTLAKAIFHFLGGENLSVHSALHLYLLTKQSKWTLKENNVEGYLGNAITMLAVHCLSVGGIMKGK